MELMDISLDKFYRFTHQRLQQRIPEPILGKIALAVSTVQTLPFYDPQNLILILVFLRLSKL